MLAGWLAAGCAFKGEGLVQRADPLVQLQTSTGPVLTLVLDADQRAVAGLDGHIVQIEGRRGLGGKLRVRTWEVPSGLHGLPAWVGPLVPSGPRLALRDHNSGVAYTLDPQDEEALRPYVGQLVLVEGHVNGPHQVRVAYYLPLEEEMPAGWTPR